MGIGVGAKVWLGVGIGVGAGVEVGLLMGAGILVATGVAVGENVGVAVAEGVSIGVGLWIEEAGFILGATSLEGVGVATASSTLADCDSSGGGFGENKNRPPMAANPEIIIIRSFEFKKTIPLNYRRSIIYCVIRSVILGRIC